jgi:hypothetical protein
MCLTKWCTQLLHSWTFATLSDSTLDEADLEAMEDALRCFEAERTIFEEVHISTLMAYPFPSIHALQHYHHLCNNLVHLMAFAHLSLDLNIFKLSKNLGESQISIMPWAKCSLPTSILTI